MEHIVLHLPLMECLFHSRFRRQAFPEETECGLAGFGWRKFMDYHRISDGRSPGFSGIAA